MKHSKTILSCALVLSLCAMAFTGCLTKKVSNVDPTSGVTNTVTVVDIDNLTIDASVLQGTTAIAVSIAVEKDPSVIPALKTSQKALDGILNGASQETTQDIINGLKAKNNPVLTTEVTSLVGTVNAIEQKLLQKYGSDVAGQISTALAKAVDAGMIIGLQGK